MFESAEVLTHDDIKNSYELIMTQKLPIAETQFDENTSLETKLAISDDAENGYKAEMNLTNPDKTNYLPFCPGSKKVLGSQKGDYMKNLVPRKGKPDNNLSFCDQTDN